MIPHRKGVFLALWLSYILILLIPVSVSALLYTSMKNTMVANANRSNLAMLEQVRQIVDNHLKEIDQLIVQIATHPKLQTLWNIREGERYVQYAEAVAALKNIRSGSGFIQSFYIHLKDPDIMITPEMKADTNLFYSRILPYQGKDVERIRTELLTGYHFKTFWPEAAVMDESRSRNVITSAVSLPLGETGNVRATLVLLIEEQQIFNLLKQIEWVNSGFMFIMDDTGQVLMSTLKGHHVPERLRELGGTTGYQTFEFDGQTMMLSYTSGQSGWKYVSLVPKKVVLQRVDEIKSLAFTFLAIALAGGTVAACWMAYRSYSPIRDMVYSLRKGRDYGSPIAFNEYEFIKSSIAESMAEGKQLRQKLESHVPVIRTYFLSRLLKGQAEPNVLRDSSLEFMGVQFPHSSVCVIVIEVDDCSGFILEDNEQEWALVRFILFNLSNEWIGDRGYVAETDRNRLALLLNVPDASESTKRERDEFMLGLKRLIEERFRMKITVATSSIREGLPEAAGRCYGEALNALDYRIIHGISSVIDYEQIREMTGSHYHYPLEMEAQLMNYVKSGDYDSAARLLDELYEQNIVSYGITPEMGKCLFFDLLSTMLKVLNALQIDEKELFNGNGDPVKHIMNSASAKVMLRRIKELCAYICQSVHEAKSDQRDRLNGKLMQYIDDHCSDNGLGLVSIAGHFGMTPQYISGFFKKQNGVNLTDYIVEIRVREAKRLLEHCELSVLQVAQKVGYATDIGFIRVFKKQEGITPGKYREMLRQAGNVKNG